MATYRTTITVYGDNRQVLTRDTGEKHGQWGAAAANNASYHRAVHLTGKVGGKAARVETSDVNDAGDTWVSYVSSGLSYMEGG